MHATVFSELGAVVSNMVRFGRGEAQVRAFLDYMCARSQLVEDQVQGGFLADQVRPKPPSLVDWVLPSSFGALARCRRELKPTP